MEAKDNAAELALVDDGHPESRDYTEKHVLLQPEPRRSWLERLCSAFERRPDAKPPAATRIVARPGAGNS